MPAPAAGAALNADAVLVAKDAMRRDIAQESRAVREFSDDCRFWVAQRA